MCLLSIVIVNYRVPHLLAQCLEAVYAALSGIDAEVWVVDNHSGDGSVDYLRSRFADVHYIELDSNLGFSRANNVAIARARGSYILLLNPDTIVGEDTLRITLAHMQEHAECGALGVKMHNIQGRYLRESKRGFPTTWVSFGKLSGLASLRPRSPLLARYYMGHLPEDQIHSVEVLSGAYMLLRGEVIRRLGGLDERFFMYGEDIDLSWRIVLAGYQCHYLPTTIIHYKGESSVLDSAQYIRSFYGAMQLFYDKYHQGWEARLGRVCIQMAIGIVSTLARLKAFVCKRCKSPAPTLVPATLPLEGQYPLGTHLLIDRQRYTHRQIIDAIVDSAPRGYTFHFRTPEGGIISPRR